MVKVVEGQTPQSNPKADHVWQSDTNTCPPKSASWQPFVELFCVGEAPQCQEEVESLAALKNPKYQVDELEFAVDKV